jgi:hypothetical protein
MVLAISGTTGRVYEIDPTRDTVIASDFDRAKRYVTAPHRTFSMAADVTGTTVVDPTSHSALFGTSGGFAVGLLPGLPEGHVEYRRAEIPSIPGNMFAADEMIVTTANANATPLVLLVAADRKSIAKVDLVQLLAQPVDVSTTYPGEFEIVPEGLAAAIVYLDVTR